MDLRVLVKIALLIFAGLSALGDRAESSSRSVTIFDSPSHSYVRHRSPGITGETNSMLLDDITASIYVLLGLPPPSLSAESSSKLNEILLPNPFERPDTVFLLEVGGIDGLIFSTQNSDFKVGNIFSSMVFESKKAKIYVPGEDDVYVFHVDENACAEDDFSCVDEELVKLAKWFGGSYAGSLKSHDGKLTIPLSTGSSLDLNVAKEADRMFAASLASLVGNTKRTVVNDFAQNRINSAELFIGHFRGLEALKVEYGEGDILKLGEQLVKDSIMKLFNTLQEFSSGRIACVVLSNKDANPSTENLLEVTQFPQLARWLDETSFNNDTSAEFKRVLLVRRSLAWITAIILLVSTLIGIYFLMNMQLTRDTLLYSNVKLD
ncbi:uncharacterized protein LOC110017872 [Phalaenopsis equestris]|uniref:uncharacterized protein LOC110017872 n=1 Tax=Phalaenopsis equestris TaxID=78828 RepID=UPI0009E38EE0|nr:uncharacterized protein LOC110017872 [Phalaenopsis equestris]